MRSVTLLSAVVILSLLVACGPSAPAATPTPEPTPTPIEVLADEIEDIVGIWVCNSLVWGSNAYVEFLADGSCRAAQAVSWLETSPWFAGEVSFEGTVLTDNCWCASGQGTYEVWLVQVGGETVALRWNTIEDDCFDRTECYQGLTKRVSRQ